MDHGLIASQVGIVLLMPEVQFLAAWCVICRSELFQRLDAGSSDTSAASQNEYMKAY